MFAEPSSFARWDRAALSAAAWAAAGAVAALLALDAWVTWGAGSDNVDLEMFFLPAGRAIMAGQSPYAVEGYYYSPVVAVLASPLSQVPWAGTAWSLGLVGLALLTCLAAVHAIGRGAPSPTRAALFAVAVVTMFSSWPFRGELILGQTDLLVMAALSLAALSASRGRHAVAGAAVAMAAAVKTWPAALLVWLLRRPRAGRAGAWLGVAVVVAGVCALALALGGPSVLTQMLTAPLRGTDQPLVAYSAWGAGKLLFTETGLVTPLTVSAPLRVATTAALLAWTLSLLAVVVRRPGPPAIALANVAFCIVLALPVAHYTYLLYPLPALWYWASRACQPRPRWGTWAAVAALVAWWLLALRRMPEGYPDVVTTLPSFLITLGATLGAATLSVVAAARDHSPTGAPHPA